MKTITLDELGNVVKKCGVQNKNNYLVKGILSVIKDYFFKSEKDYLFLSRINIEAISESLSESCQISIARAKKILEELMKLVIYKNSKEINFCNRGIFIVGRKRMKYPKIKYRDFEWRNKIPNLLKARPFEINFN